METMTLNAIGVSGFVAAVTVAGLIACSSPVDHRVLPASLFPQAYGQALCASLDHCCAENQVGFVDTECTAGWKAYAAARLADPIAASNYDERVAQNCIDAIRAAQKATCEAVPGSISDARAVCQNVFAGHKPLGAPCTSSLECAPAEGMQVGCQGLPIPIPDAGLLPLSVNPLADVVSPPTCVVIPPPVAGDRCTTPALVAYCESSPELSCDRVAGVCRELQGAGSPCQTNGCLPGFYCEAQLCTPKAVVGDACKTNEQCGGISRCDKASGKCVDRFRGGERCATDADCTIGKCEAAIGKCLTNAIATTTTCRGRYQ
jgi:hypothetical protein